MTLLRREVPDLPPALFDQPEVGDLHAAVHRLAHVVDREAGDRAAVSASISTPVLPSTFTVAVTSIVDGLRRPARNQRRPW